MKPRYAIILVLVVVSVSCTSVPAKRIDSISYGASTADLASPLGDVTVTEGAFDEDIERVIREVFPVAAAHLGIEYEGIGRAEYRIWLRSDQYTIGLTTYSTVFCSLKLCLTEGGAVLASTVLVDETPLGIRSSGYTYGLIREALRSLHDEVLKTKKAESGGS